MVSVRSSVFEEPAPYGARRVALSLLDEVSAAAERLSADADSDALHDFRVSLRRLRTWTGELEGPLGKQTHRRVRKRLRKLMKATNAGRDAEVFLQWLTEVEDRLEREALAVARRLSDDTRAELKATSTPIEDALREIFDPLRGELEEKLAAWRATLDLRATPREPSFGSVLAHLLRVRGGELAELLYALEGAGAEEESHRARIAGKRVRYLVEPIAPHLGTGPRLVERLKELQDALGDLHDAHLWLHRIRSPDEDPEAGVEGAGLAELRGMAEAHARNAFMRFLGCRDALDRESIPDQIEATARELDARGAHNLEIERKYLLRGMPELPLEHTSVVISQGYLPGERLVERVRAIEDAGGQVSHVRTVKLGTGIARIEVEETIDPSLYGSLWPLTAGRRLSKRRYSVCDGGLVWEIDEFLDRDLVLAEVELESEGAEVVLPDWLAPVVEREVTEEAAYLNRTLAR